ncbi:putative membrane protein [Desulfosporosinus orientis DSM 765]|uniref:Putative membrane protein n=1 Tax=Desulfosporosinus orientis (strain ATCC 19365 / DSM 765 / NCIMB 8382 / VKM B-1628 / Singapore I) TaxID=768706 RepID=G7W9R2_DESOD|nr:DUF202 domain-containing protein [Desulfosporosinus orientis]AET70628.1 putative membrane protein [Desulfosporosinus orientis DSM 765]
MSKTIKEAKQAKAGDPRFYMANERTFLAWIRTSIGIMGFGFVVERFSLFVRQMAYVLGQDEHTLPSSLGSSSIVGIILVGLGAIMSVSAFIKYKRTEKQITEGTYESSSILNTALTGLVLAVGVFLVFYIIQST